MVTATFDDFMKIDIRAGNIVAVGACPRARNPSYKVTVDLGTQLGQRRSSVQAKNYSIDELVGMVVVCVVNFPPKNIAGFQSKLLVLAVPAEDGGISLITPSKPARTGGRVS